MGLDESTFLSEQDIAAARMIFRVTGNASTNATINFRQSAPTDTNIVYHFNIRPNDAAIIQNTLNGGWGGEERVSYAAAGLVAGQAFTLYIAMSPSVISLQNAARGIVHNYTFLEKEQSNWTRPGTSKQHNAPSFISNFLNISLYMHICRPF